MEKAILRGRDITTSKGEAGQAERPCHSNTASHTVHFSLFHAIMPSSFTRS